MDRLGKMAISIWILILGGGALVGGLLLWGTTFMGDMIYPIEIQNSGPAEIEIRIHRFVYFRTEKRLTVDTVVLKPQDKLDIGTSHDCAKIDTTLLDIHAMEIVDEANKTIMINRENIADYLSKHEKVGCATYLIQ